MTVGFWVCIIVTWNVLEMMAEVYQTMSTLMLFCQCLSIVQV